MQIISKFKDYYDCMQKFASYEDRPFIRNFIKHDISRNIFNLPQDCFKIGFCGKIYTGKYVAYRDDNNEYCTDIAYDYEEYCHIVSKSLYSKNLMLKNKESRRKHDVIFRATTSDEFFILYNCPVFIVVNNWGSDCLMSHSMNKADTKKESWQSYNPKVLSDYFFNNVVPANIAYMEIESYISGVLFKENKSVPDMTNEDKINLSGHHKDSFKGK